MGIKSHTNMRTSPIWNIPKTELEEIIRASSSLADILRYFNFAIKSSNYITLKLRIKEDKIDISHIQLGVGANKGKKGISNNSIPLENVLIKNSTYSRCVLKARLLKNGMLKNICYICGQLPEWNGKPLSLQIDHINGINNDNRLENLRILCPHCHCQTETFSGKNKPKPSKNMGD